MGSKHLSRNEKKGKKNTKIFQVFYLVFLDASIGTDLSWAGIYQKDIGQLPESMRSLGNELKEIGRNQGCQKTRGHGQGQAISTVHRVLTGTVPDPVGTGHVLLLPAGLHITSQVPCSVCPFSSKVLDSSLSLTKLK